MLYFWDYKEILSLAQIEKENRLEYQEALARAQKPILNLEQGCMRRSKFRGRKGRIYTSRKKICDIYCMCWERKHKIRKCDSWYTDKMKQIKIYQN